LDGLLDHIQAPVAVGFDGRVGILQDVPDVSTEVQYPFLVPDRLADLHGEIGELSHLARDKRLGHSRALFQHGMTGFTLADRRIRDSRSSISRCRPGRSRIERSPGRPYLRESRPPSS